MKQALSLNTEFDWLKLAEQYNKQIVKGIIPDTLSQVNSRNPQYFEVSIAFSKDDIISNQITQVPFTIQSISKFIVLLYILEQSGKDNLLQKVGLSASKIDYNTTSAQLFLTNNVIVNPFINAGALTIVSMIKGETSFEKIQRIQQFIEQQFMIHTTIDEDVYFFEKQHSSRNIQITKTLLQYGLLEDHVDVTLDTYLQLCALRMTTKDLAKMGVIFREMIALKHSNALIAHEAMISCGLYRASPLIVQQQKIAAKSGVSGGILAYSTLPCHPASNFDKIGLGIYSPLLNQDGNSAKAYLFLQDFFRNY